MRGLNVIAWISASLGVAAGITALLIAVEHNPQGALVDQSTGAADFRYALLLFSSWFFIGTIVTGLAVSAVWLAITLLRGVFTK
jgi:hypothetical protein